MLRPLAVDLLDCLIPLVLAAALFLLGWVQQRWSYSLRRFMVLIVTSAVVFVGLCLVRWLPVFLDPVLYWLGGPKAFLAALALFLLAVALNTTGRTFSDSFLWCLCGVAAFMVLVEATGALTWRFVVDEPWHRNVDSQGRLTQSTLRTCGPAAAVMLLHRYGISASEGEIAYLARTSLFGSDGYALSEAVREKAEQHDLTARFLRSNYVDVLGEGRPFVATIREGLAAHAVFVDVIDEAYAYFVDPSNGERYKVPRHIFESIWNGEMIEIRIDEPRP